MGLGGVMRSNPYNTIKVGMKMRLDFIYDWVRISPQLTGETV